MNKRIKKIAAQLAILWVLVYIVFAIIPEKCKFSFPTGGWDWLNFIGILLGLFFGFYSLSIEINENNKALNKQQEEQNSAVLLQQKLDAEKLLEQQKYNNDLLLKQKQLEHMPCLDANIYNAYLEENNNNIYRVFSESNGRIVNNGYTMPRISGKNTPKDFKASFNLKITNLGLSTAFRVTLYLYKLEGVEGLTDIKDIEKFDTPFFYEKIKCSNYEYAEFDTVKNNDWLISPEFNLSTDHQEYNYVMDLSKTAQNYNFIIEFRFEDVYDNNYFQYLFLYKDTKGCGGLPLSKLYHEKLFKGKE